MCHCDTMKSVNNFRKNLSRDTFESAKIQKNRETTGII